MKRLISAALSLILLLSLSFTFFGCEPKEPDNAYIARQLGLELPEYSMFSFARDHVDGDRGYVFGEMTFAEETGAQVYESMLTTPGWQVLPLPEELSLMVYGGSDDNTVYASYTDDLIPRVDYGCYFYKDRRDGGKSGADPGERFSGDFIIAIYDSASCVLYYYELSR